MDGKVPKIQTIILRRISPTIDYIMRKEQDDFFLLLTYLMGTEVSISSPFREYVRFYFVSPHFSVILGKRLAEKRRYPMNEGYYLPNIVVSFQVKMNCLFIITVTFTVIKRDFVHANMKSNSYIRIICINLWWLYRDYNSLRCSSWIRVFFSILLPSKGKCHINRVISFIWK